MEGATGRAREAAFPTQPRARSGLPLIRWALPFLPAAGCSGPGLKLNTLSPVSSPSGPPRPTPRTLRFSVGHREEALEVARFLLRLAQTDLAVVQPENGTRAWPVYVSTILPKNLKKLTTFLQSALV